MNGYAVAAVALGLWWVSRKRAARRASGCGCKNKAVLDAAEPVGGTDCTGNWWQRLHGADLSHPQYLQYTGVSMDPSAADKPAIAAAIGVQWNGDARA